MAHTRSWKSENMKQLSDSMKSAKVVGIVSITGLPAAQFQQIRKKLNGVAEIHVSRAKLIKMAIAQAEKDIHGLGQLQELVSRDQTALICSNQNPFSLFRTLEKNKTHLAARGGEIAPDDIEIKAGETSFKPGPIVGELQKAGLPASIEGGKVVIKKDKMLVRKGEAIPPAVASALTRMEIFPLIAGLEVKAMFEEGLVFRQDVLQVDDAQILSDLSLASRQALSLAVKGRYFTPQSVRYLLGDAHKNAVNLSVNAEIPTKETVNFLLSKASAQASALKKKTGDA